MVFINQSSDFATQPPPPQPQQQQHFQTPLPKYIMPSNTFATCGPNLVGHTLDHGRLELFSILGTGAYGVVYLALDLHAPTPVYLAVKCLLRSGLDARQKHFQRREIALHQLASRHPGVVTLHMVIEEGDYAFVVLDFCDEGDLFGMITERQRYLGNDALIKSVFLQIIDAVEYCHSMGIFHRDLKPENILCTRDGERICIADFGLATSERTSTDFGCGSTFYLSPECQGGLFTRLSSYNTATNDIWALGVILVNLTCGRNPWRQACPSDETFRAFVHDSNFLRTILPISNATNRILKGLFALEPVERMTLRELRKEVMRVDTWTMSEDELRGAHSAARAAAAAVRPKQRQQPAPTPAQVKVQPQPEPENDMMIDPTATIYSHIHGHDHNDGVPRIPNWSTSSAFSIEPSMLDQIDFNHQVQAPTPRQHVSPVFHIAVDPPVLKSSRSSSSSGSGDISLPPTPEFNPASDRLAPGGNVPKWDLSGKITPPRADLLHVNIHSASTSPSPEFSYM